MLARIKRLGHRLVQPHLDQLRRRRSEEGLEVDRLVAELVALMQQQNGRLHPRLALDRRELRLDLDPELVRVLRGPRASV